MVDYGKMGERISEIRKGNKLTQEKLAEMADMTPTNLSHIERGKTKASVGSIVALANAMGSTPNDFLCDSLKYATQESLNEISTILADCSQQELRLVADIAAVIKRRFGTPSDLM